MFYKTLQKQGKEVTLRPIEISSMADERYLETSWLENIGDIMDSSKGEILWMIPEVFVINNECCISSPLFDFDGGTWRLVMMPSDGMSALERGNQFIALFLWMTDSSTAKKEYDVKLGLRTYNGDDLYTCTGPSVSEYGFGTWDFLRLSIITPEESMNGRMKIFCVIERKEYAPEDILSSATNDEDKNKSEGNKENQNQKETPESKGGVDRLVKNFKTMLNDEWGSDVVLKTEDHKFHAHRAILRARSPVFASMFEHEMRETTTGEVDILDCSRAGFEVFLEYLYTASVDSMSGDNVLDLFYIADKYHVDDLKADCTKFLKKYLSVDNFCDIIALSLRHNELDLQKTATQFYCRNVRAIIKTVQWQKYLSKYPMHANELYMKAIRA